MKTHSLTAEQMKDVCDRALTASFATLNSDGSPYVIPVHFVYCHDCVYIHCRPQGQKTDNIEHDPRVSLAIYEMDDLLLDPDEKPCSTNTKYESVVITGTASIVDDLAVKQKILAEVVRKYTPHLDGKPFKENSVKVTAVIQVKIASMTGKYYG